MFMDWISILISILIGICSGAVTGLIGASGVLVVVPALTMALNLPVHVAIGTSLAVDVMASIVVTYTYYRNKNVDLKSGIWLALGAVAGAQLGSILSVYIPELELGGLFGIFLILSGISFWSKKARQRLHLFSEASKKVNNEQEASIKKTNLAKKKIAVTVLIGFSIGIVSGILGAGGGVMFLLVLIFVLKYPVHKAVGTSTLIMAITAASGAVGYSLNGNISLVIALVVGVGTILGSRLGALYANRASEETLAKIVGLVFLTLGAVMIITQFIR
jgi:uncharacterized membrane protein YfcA